MLSHSEPQKIPPLVDLTFLGEGAPWPPPSQVTRLTRYAENQKLWKGDHSRVLTDQYWKLVRPEIGASVELVFNWHKRISTLFADLMLSEPPRFYADVDETDPPDDAADKNPATDPESREVTRPRAASRRDTEAHTSGAAQARQDAIDRIAGKDENGYATTLYEIAIDVSRYGNGLAKITLEEDGAGIWAYSPHYWFPIVSPNNIRKVTHHLLAWKIQSNGNEYLWTEIHEKGSITRRAYKLEGNLIGTEVPLAAFDASAKAYEETKVNDFLVVPFAGLQASDEIFGNDDYSDLDSIIKGIETRAAQIMKILDKHSDPSMYGPPELLERDGNGQYVFKAGGMYFDVDGSDDDVVPGYVTWDGHLESQFAELDFLLKQLYILSETSAAAFGQLESGLAESGSALRRLMQAPLAKVARVTMRFDPAAKRVLKVAAALERNNGLDTPPIDTVHIQWQDGLPADPMEQAETEEIRIRSGTSSCASAIRRIDGGSQEEAEAELERIREEEEEKVARALAEEGERARIAAEHAPARGTGPPGAATQKKPPDKSKESK